MARQFGIRTSPAADSAERFSYDCDKVTPVDAIRMINARFVAASTVTQPATGLFRRGVQALTRRFNHLKPNL